MNHQVARTLRIVVYTLLLASTAVAIFFNERPHRLWGEGELPSWAHLVAPVSFALFSAVFALDRLWAVRQQHYPTTRALMQVACALLLLTLLLPPRPATPPLRPEGDPATSPPDAQELGLWPAQLLLQYEDEAVRQATCELLAGELLGVPHPMPPGHPVEALRGLLAELAEDDPVASVRAACSEALSQLGPQDLDPSELDEGGGCPARPLSPEGEDDAWDDTVSDSL